MSEIITHRDIAEFIRLRKAKAELAFKQQYLQNNGGNKDATIQIENELKAVESQLSALESKFKRASFCVIVPNDKKICELSNKINSEDHASIVEALKSKSGPLYELLAERGKLLLQNSEMCDEIGKLNIILHKLDEKSRAVVGEAIMASSPVGKTELKPLDEKTKLRMARILKRLGIAFDLAAESKNSKVSFEETEINLDNKKIWVPSQVASAVKENSTKIETLLKKIQLKNAERQIKRFTEDEENEFAKMQREYLGLLKQKDALLKEHYEECKEEIVVGS